METLPEFFEQAPGVRRVVDHSVSADIYSFSVAFSSLRQALYHILSGSVLQFLSKIGELITVNQLGLGMDRAVELLPEDPPVQDVPIESWYFEPL